MGGECASVADRRPARGGTGVGDVVEVRPEVGPFSVCRKWEVLLPQVVEGALGKLASSGGLWVGACVNGVFVRLPLLTAVAEWVFVRRMFVHTCSGGVQFPHSASVGKAKVGGFEFSLHAV